MCATEPLLDTDFYVDNPERHAMQLAARLIAAEGWGTGNSFICLLPLRSATICTTHTTHTTRTVRIVWILPSSFSP